MGEQNGASSRTRGDNMTSPARRLLWIILALLALGVIAAVAFGLGVGWGHGGGWVFYRRGFGPGMMGWGAGGGGWFGLIPFLTLVFVGIFLFVLFASGDRRYHSTGPGTAGAPGSGAAPAPNDVDRLRELSELHDRGQLTDEEFAAAKRKLLGL